jgi:hypothetical protein
MVTSPEGMNLIKLSQVTVDAVLRLKKQGLVAGIDSYLKVTDAGLEALGFDSEKTRREPVFLFPRELTFMR